MAGSPYSDGVAPVWVTIPPLMKIRVLRLRAVQGSGGGSGFVVCSVGLLVGCAAGFVRWWGRERICGIGLVGVGL